MGRTHEHIDGRLREFIEAQHIFFVGTAPLAADGHVNISPKGHRDTFAILDDTTVAYLDLTGSGAESIAHIRQNGRIVIMFCAFDGPPQIIRLHGTARVVEPSDAAWKELAPRFPARPGARAIVTVDVERISSSCGYAVPYYDHVGDRDLLERWVGRKSDTDLAAYWNERNSISIDDLPAL